MLLTIAKYGNPVLRQNWMTREDVSNLLYLSGFELMRTWQEVLWPVRTPVSSTIASSVITAMTAKMARGP